MNISIEIKAPELASAIMALASALSGNKMLNGESFGQPETAATQQQPVGGQPIQQQYQAPPQQPEIQAAPPLHAVPVAQPIQQAPVQQMPMHQPPVQQQQMQQQVPVQQAPQAVPTAAPGYSMDQLAVAATQLVDANKREELVQLLATFGVNALTALPKEQYGAFATKLREMGAKI